MIIPNSVSWESLLLSELGSNFVFKAYTFAIIFTSILIIGSSSSVYAAQLDARIVPDAESAKINIRYQRTVYLEYPQGGDLADILRNRSWDVTIVADGSNPGVQDLISKLNQKIANDGGHAQITDMDLTYSATLTGRGVNTAIDYKLSLSPTLSFYNIRQYSPNSPSLVDMGWRGLTATSPITIDGVEINLPISIIKTQEPKAYEILAGTEGEALLSKNLINANGIRDQPLKNWHFLFDPTGINVDAGTFGLSEEISGFVVSSYTMGESSIREGRQVEKEEDAAFTKDKPYSIRSIESADSATISLIGFAAIDILEGTEFFGVTPKAPENYATTSTGEFPVMIIYGMAGLAGVGAIAILFISSRKLKAEEGQGQTGIDPSLLRGVATSAASGGYQTVRGEAHLANETHDQTKSVYDIELKEETEKDTGSSSSRGSMPKGWKPK